MKKTDREQSWRKMIDDFGGNYGFEKEVERQISYLPPHDIAAMRDDVQEEFKQKVMLELMKHDVNPAPFQAAFPEALQQVEGMDEDMRQILEIFMQACSSIRPHQPFLQMMHESSLPKGGQKTRYQWNVEAIRLMKQIEFENRAATPEEQKVLARYVGWGGIPQVFDGRNESWKKEYEELRNLLSEVEYMDARESVNTAFYTSPEIIEAVYQGLSRLGFQKGTILEPSAGVGHFFGGMPEDMCESKLYGVEKDNISGRIAALLYPEADIKIGGFEDTFYSDNFFDVAVGNDLDAAIDRVERLALKPERAWKAEKMSL